MDAGAVASVAFPFSESEDEPFKRRPVLILGSAGTGANAAILVAMITSNPRRVKTPGRFAVLIEDWEAAGLDKPSVVRVGRLWTAEPRDFRGVRGSVSPDVLAEVRERITRLFSFG